MQTLDVKNPYKANKRYLIELYPHQKLVLSPQLSTIPLISFRTPSPNWMTLQKSYVTSLNHLPRVRPHSLSLDSAVFLPLIPASVSLQLSVGVWVQVYGERVSAELEFEVFGPDPVFCLSGSTLLLTRVTMIFFFSSLFRCFGRSYARFFISYL